MIAWTLHDPSERLNHADTMKIQWSAALRRGRVLFSDMGRAMLSITEDTSGMHDALVGGSTAASTLERHGPGPWRNTRDNLVLAALKLGLSHRDVASYVTFFAPVSVGADGRFVWHEEMRRSGDFVELRAEMPLRLVLSTAPHPLDPAPAYAPGAVEAIRWRGPVASADDPCRTASPEARRGFENSEAALCLLAMAPRTTARRARASTTKSPPGSSGPASSGRGSGYGWWTPTGSKPSTPCSSYAHDYAERYSAQDTLRCQGSAYVTTGTRLLSNKGREMLTVTADDCGRHDTSAGACSCESNSVRFGHDTRFLHACRDNFCLELSRHGMTKRDIVPNLNLFMNVPVAPNGDLVVADGISAPGSAMEMVAAMDVLCVISNCPQVNSPCNGYHPTPVRLQVFAARAE